MWEAQYRGQQVFCGISCICIYLMNDPRCITKEKTTSWLLNVQSLGENEKHMWSSLKIDGKSLPLVTVDLLVECGMAVGPSLKVDI